MGFFNLFLFFYFLIYFIVALTFYFSTQKKSVSPELLECRDLELAVPGTYKAGKFRHMVS